MSLFNKIQVVTKLWYDDYLVFENGVAKIIYSSTNLKCSYKLYKDYDTALLSLFKGEIRSIDSIRNSIYNVIYKFFDHNIPLTIYDFSVYLREKLEWICKDGRVDSPFYYVRILTKNGSYVPHNDIIYKNDFIKMLVESVYGKGLRFVFSFTDFTKLSTMYNDVEKVVVKTSKQWGRVEIKGILIDTTLPLNSVVSLSKVLLSKCELIDTKLKLISVPDNYIAKYQDSYALCTTNNYYGFDVITLSSHNISDIFGYKVQDLGDMWGVSAYGGNLASGDYTGFDLKIGDYKKSDYKFYKVDYDSSTIDVVTVKEVR